MYIGWRKKEKDIIFKHNKILASFYGRKKILIIFNGPIF